MLEERGANVVALHAHGRDADGLYWTVSVWREGNTDSVRLVERHLRTHDVKSRYLSGIVMDRMK